MFQKRNILTLIIQLLIYLPQNLGLFINLPTSAYLNPNIKLQDCIFKQQLITMISTLAYAPYTKYLYSFDVSTLATSNNLTLDNCMTKLIQGQGTDPKGIYHWLVMGDDGNGTTRVMVYNQSDLSLVNSWNQSTNNGILMTFGETHEIIYKSIKTPTCYILEKWNQTTNSMLRVLLLSNSLGIPDSIFYDPDAQQLISYAARTSDILAFFLYPNVSGIRSFLLPYQAQQKLTIQRSKQYTAVGIGNTITNYNMTTGLPLWSVVLEAQVIALQVKDKWVIAMTVGKLWQIGPDNFVMSNTLIQASYNKMGIVTVNNMNWVGVWASGGSIIEFFQVQDQYFCDASQGCSCITQYCFTNHSQVICNYTGNVSCPDFSLPKSIVVKSVDACLYRNQEGVCTEFCDMKCGDCLNNPYSCTVCRSKYYMLQENGGCQKNFQFKIIATVFSSLNVLKINSIQPFYLFLDRFELYNYHSVTYIGIFYEVLAMADYSKQYFWSILGLQPLEDWIDRPINNLPSYLGYTPHKFQQVQRKDLLFIQNTKDYFLIYLPLSSLLFFIINRLFYLSYENYFSSFIRIYSFWFQLWGIVVIQNLSMLWYLCFNELRTLFSFRFIMRLIRMSTVPIIGVIFIISISYYYLSQYFYGKLSKHFTTNLRKSKNCSLLMLFRYIIKPILQSTFTSLFSENMKTLFISLISSQFCTLAVMISFQLAFNIFKSKLVFSIECIVQFLMILLNLLLLINYEIYPELEIYQEFITVFIYLLVAAFGFLLLVGLVSVFSSCKKQHFKCINRKKMEFRKRNSKKKQKKKQIYKIKVEVLKDHPCYSNQKPVIRIKLISKEKKNKQAPSKRNKIKTCK